ncbi:MAG: hypothetical protein OXT65_08650 [Alphaproteobacteria bacterium]|nr:hypothetical protein [Alphaproteobacteria bacterium]
MVAQKPPQECIKQFKKAVTKGDVKAMAESTLALREQWEALPESTRVEAQRLEAVFLTIMKSQRGM